MRPTRVRLSDPLRTHTFPRLVHPDKVSLPTLLVTVLTQYVFAGVGIGGDVTRLHRAYNNMPRVRVIDLAANGSPARALGTQLSNVVEWATKKPLDKHCQRSKWDERPLAAPQVDYAALDVLAPLLVVETLAKQRRTLRVYEAGNGSKGPSKQVPLITLMPLTCAGAVLPFAPPLLNALVVKPFGAGHEFGMFRGTVTHVRDDGEHTIVYEDTDTEKVPACVVESWQARPQAAYAHPDVGTTFRKKFGNATFEGRVVFVADGLFRVWYGVDDDFEDLSPAQFAILPKIKTTLPTAQPKDARTSSDAMPAGVARIRRAVSAEPAVVPDRQTTVAPHADAGPDLDSTRAPTRETQPRQTQETGTRYASGPSWGGKRFTQVEERRIRELVYGTGDGQEVVVQHFFTKLLRKDVYCLREGGYLNDEVIHFFLHVAMSPISKCHVFQFFMDKVMKPKPEPYP